MRTREPGLSVVVPYVPAELSPVRAAATQRTLLEHPNITVMLNTDFAGERGQFLPPLEDAMASYLTQGGVRWAEPALDPLQAQPAREYSTSA